MLTALVQKSVFRRLPNSCPEGRIQDRTRGCKWSLLKVRDGKYKGKHSETQVEARRERVSAFQVLLKPKLTYGKGRARRFPAMGGS
jgi:hypothetical protein